MQRPNFQMLLCVSLLIRETRGFRLTVAWRREFFFAFNWTWRCAAPQWYHQPCGVGHIKRLMRPHRYGRAAPRVSSARRQRKRIRLRFLQSSSSSSKLLVSSELSKEGAVAPEAKRIARQGQPSRSARLFCCPCPWQPVDGSGRG